MHEVASPIAIHQYYKAVPPAEYAASALCLLCGREGSDIPLLPRANIFL